MASREPSPAETYTRISLGDVGFIRRGQFHRLFSAGRRVEDQERGNRVPRAFEILPTESTSTRQPLSLDIHTDTIRETGASVGVSVSPALLCVQFFEPSSHS